LFPNDDLRNNFKLLMLSVGDKEYQSTVEYFKETMPYASIFSVKKVVNHHLRKAWEFERSLIREKTLGKDCVVSPTMDNQVKLLFHGTRSCRPHVICNSDKGFLPQFAGMGMWGLGTYFSEKAAYSDRYAYRMPKEEILEELPMAESSVSKLRQMILCEVIVGDSCYSFPNKSLKIPPAKNPGAVNSHLDFAVNRYDSIWGITFGTKVYVTYDSPRAYPTYLITYQDILDN